MSTKDKRLHIAFNNDLGMWCMYNVNDPNRHIPLDGYNLNTESQRKAAQDVCDMFELFLDDCVEVQP